jgi:DNA-directed RNA polymerase specialized sigma24 family protein
MVEGLDYGRIAERLGVSAETARGRMHAAKQEIKKHIPEVNP